MLGWIWSSGHPLPNLSQGMQQLPRGPIFCRVRGPLWLLLGGYYLEVSVRPGELFLKPLYAQQRLPALCGRASQGLEDRIQSLWAKDKSYSQVLLGVTPHQPQPLAHTPQMVKVMKNKERLRSCHRPEEPQETGPLNATGILDGALGQKGDIHGKTEAIWIKSGV